MKNFNLKNFFTAFLFLLITTGFSAQNFSEKTDEEIAKLFISTSNSGKDRAAGKTFNKNLITFLNKENSDPSAKVVVDMRYANIFKALYATDKNTAYQFLMTSTNSYVGMAPFLTQEHKDFIKTQSRARIENYTSGKTTASASARTNTTDSRYNERGFYHNSFKKSDYKIYFPPSTIYSNYSPLYLPKMQYLTSAVSTGFIRDLDYMRATYKGSSYASVRFTPNIPSYHLQNQISIGETMAMIFTAINHIFPTEEYTKAKQSGGTYIIKSTVKPINWSSDYYLVVNGSSYIVAKAHRMLGGHEMIVQIISTNRTLKYEQDLSSDEKYFLNDALVIAGNN